MIGQRISHFRIVEKIGEGGMGVVYRAEDEKLGRSVALKVLPPESMGNEERRMRFLREARTAAAVNHPHIATVYEVDEVTSAETGQHVVFIAMELLEGRTLGRCIDGRPLPIRDALRTAIELAEALARAHKADVIHRDLKPENIIIGPDRHAKILDFGLAKLREQVAQSDDTAADATMSAEMTQDGKILGTASYMSPEQARGIPVDHRSDIFSFGVVLYEMLTGHSPFTGATITDTLSAVLRDTPERPTQSNADVPAALEPILSKCLEKDPNNRYQHADELAVDLRNLRRDLDSQSVSQISSPVLPAAPAEKKGWLRPVALVAAGLAVLALALIAIRMTGSGGLTPSVQAADNSLAVLPLQNLKDDNDPERLGQILQELIITDLSSANSLKVFSSQRLHDIRKELGAGGGTSIDRDVATDVARRAGAATMLTGSLSQLGSKWILTCQLVNVADGAVIKSERIDGSDLYTMVDGLTARIRSDLDLGTTAGESVELAVKDKTTPSLDAMHHYLNGVDLLNEMEFEDAIEEFGKALEIDPEFGQAQYKLAVASSWFEGDQNWWVTGDPASPTELFKQLLSGDFRLSRKEKLLAEAFAFIGSKDFPAAVPLFEELVEQYPDEKEAWYGLGEALVHSPEGATDPEACAAFERALDLDPSFRLAYSHVSGFHQINRSYSEARDRVRELMDRNPDDTGWYGWWLRWVMRAGDEGEVDAAVAEARRRVTDPRELRQLLQGLGWDYRWQLGDIERGEQFMREAVEVGDEGPDAWASLGWFLLWQTWDDVGAERAFRRAREIDPSDPGALSGVFSVHNWRRDTEAHLAEAKRLIAEDPDRSPLYSFWIQAAINSGDGTETKTALDAALAHASTVHEQKELWERVARAYRGVGDLNRAAHYLGRASELAADDDTDHIWQRVELAMEQRDFPAAERWVHKALDIFPNQEDAFKTLARSRMHQGDYASALDHANEALGLDPNSSTAWQLRIAVHLLSGDAAEAERDLEQALGELDSEVEKCQLLDEVGQAYAAAGRDERAAQLMGEARNSAPCERNPWRYADLALFLARLDRFEEAEQALERSLEIHPSNWLARWRLAELAVLAGDATEAERQLQQVASVRHHNDIWILADVRALQGRWSEAEALAREALEMGRSVRKSYAQLSWILIAADLDLEEGIRLAQRAIEAPEDVFMPAWRLRHWASPEHALGLAYLKQGQSAEAKRWLEEALRLRPDRAELIQADLARLE